MQKNNEKIVIAMPVFNGERFIGEAIDSVLSQNFSNFELIISDNASTDKTLEICKIYAENDSRIKIYSQKDNLGAFGNFKFLLECSSADYFMWLAADDKMGHPEFLERLLNYMKINNLDFSFPDVSIINSQSMVIVDHVMLPFRDAKSKYENTFGALKISSHQFYSLFKKKVLDEDFRHIVRFKNLRNYGEGVFVLWITLNRRGGLVSNCFKLYRVHGDNASIAVEPKNDFIDFLRYSLAAHKLLITSTSLPLGQRIYLATNLFLRHARHSFRIVMRIGKGFVQARSRK